MIIVTKNVKKYFHRKIKLKRKQNKNIMQVRREYLIEVDF
jgi:hypothetical protein